MLYLTIGTVVFIILCGIFFDRHLKKIEENENNKRNN